MTKITFTDLTSLSNESAFLTALNANFAAIETFSDLILSRNGASPNTMSATLDMNSNRLINLPAPVDNNDAVRLVDVVDGIKGDKGDTGDPGGPLADGDYGDVVVSGTGTVISFDTSVVTAFAKTLLDDADAATFRTTLGLGTAAVADVGTGSGDVAAGDDSRFYASTYNGQNSNYTFVLTDAGKFVYHDSASSDAYTIPPESSVAFPTGTHILVHNTPASNAITLERGASVALYKNGGTTSANGTIAAGGTVQLIKLGSNLWVAIGPGLT